MIIYKEYSDDLSKRRPVFVGCLSSVDAVLFVIQSAVRGNRFFVLEQLREE